MEYASKCSANRVMTAANLANTTMEAVNADRLRDRDPDRGLDRDHGAEALGVGPHLVLDADHCLVTLVTLVLEVLDQLDLHGRDRESKEME